MQLEDRLARERRITSGMASPWSGSVIAPPIELPVQPVKPKTDINWKEYVPARPPEDGEYLVVRIYGNTREIDKASFTKANHTWQSETSYLPIPLVTHYAKLELPA